MTTEMKNELIKNINNSFGFYKLEDYTEKEINEYNIIHNLLTNKKGEQYDTLNDICDAQKNKIVAIDKRLNNPEILVFNNTKYQNDIDNYNYVKSVYEDNKKTYEARVNKLAQLEEMYKDDKENPLYASNKELLEAQVNGSKKTLDETQKEYDAQLANINSLAKKELEESDLEARKNECINIMNYTFTYANMEKNINRTASVITTNSVNNALNVLNNAYKEYHNNHTFIGRFFKWFPGTSANKDYKDFCDVRDTFKAKVGDLVNMEHVNAYLDKKINLETFNNLAKENIEDYNDSLKIAEIEVNKTPITLNEETNNDLTKENDPMVEENVVTNDTPEATM